MKKQLLGQVLTVLLVLVLLTLFVGTIYVSAFPPTAPQVPGGSGTGDLLADGTIPLTANWDVGAYKITALTFESDQATGTAPFSVASATVVTNLNADTVDGSNATDFETADADITKADVAETIAANWDFTANPMANNEVVDIPTTKITGWGTPTVRDADATPEVINGGFYSLTNAGALTVTNFLDSDGDESEFADGQEILILMADADIKIQFAGNAQIEGNGGVDFTASASQVSYLHFVYENTRWNCVNLWGMKSPTELGLSAITGIPITLSEDVGITIDATADGMADDSYQCTRCMSNIVAGSDVAEFALVVLAADGKYDEGDADNALFPVRGMAVACPGGGGWPCQVDEAMTILIEGFVRNDGWPEALTPGDTLYLDDTADGTIDDDAPATATDCVQVVGWAVSEDEMFVDISTTWVIVP